MVRVREQLGDRFRFSRVVIATGLTMSIYEHYSRAVHGNSVRIAAIRHGKFEAVMRKLVDRRFGSGEKIAASRLSLYFVGVAAQTFPCVLLVIYNEREQVHVR